MLEEWLFSLWNLSNESPNNELVISGCHESTLSQVNSQVWFDCNPDLRKWTSWILHFCQDSKLKLFNLSNCESKYNTRPVESIFLSCSFMDIYVRKWKVHEDIFQQMEPADKSRCKLKWFSIYQRWYSGRFVIKTSTTLDGWVKCCTQTIT